MKVTTENYIILEFERKRNIKFREKRLFEDFKIIENMALNLGVQKSTIIEVLEKNNFKIE